MSWIREEEIDLPGHAGGARR